MMDSLHFKAHKKSNGSIGLVKFPFKAMLRLIARNMGNKLFGSKGTLFQRLGTTI